MHQAPKTDILIEGLPHYILYFFPSTYPLPSNSSPQAKDIESSIPNKFLSVWQLTVFALEPKWLGWDSDEYDFEQGIYVLYFSLLICRMKIIVIWGINLKSICNKVKKPSRYYLNQVIRVNITNNEPSWAPNMMHWEEDNITSVVLLPKIHNLNWIMKTHQKNPNWEIFYKVTGTYSSKMTRLWNIRKGRGIILDCKRLAETTNFSTWSRIIPWPRREER